MFKKLKKEAVDNTLFNNFLHLYEIERGENNCKSYSCTQYDEKRLDFTITFSIAVQIRLK
ncbi:hypothetical protein GCA01S_082_00060 [Parageobacillus caldoxylosilyticus NBRC 107762]|uniref:Uncharacterized protein n=1 Tax=Parageobacillus caldoxylosilyticus NBRC 107762 TaxID=1220594 RepID=A0A023DK41_9BACL|nr:hypothetical protein GCA01S_082_00060 [Parageobacillus caldoxylosilyticus NBRC 107762]